MSVDEFLALLVTALVERAGDELGSVERIDSRSLGVEIGRSRFILDVEAIDETPDPIIALLRRGATS